MVVCPITTDAVDAIAFRVTLEPGAGNGLKQLSQVMVDKISTVLRMNYDGNAKPAVKQSVKH